MLFNTDKFIEGYEGFITVKPTGNSGKIDAFLKLVSGYEILELARTGVAGLGRGTKNVIYLDKLI